MSNYLDFEPFPKIPRLKRQCTITEKIDGTNAQILIKDCQDPLCLQLAPLITINGVALFAGSRSRWVTPEDDNYGFAKWVKQNGEELVNLGYGRHFGEWWGAGIQRRYNQTTKRFSLFNTHRWGNPVTEQDGFVIDKNLPACCDVVPVLYEGEFTDWAVDRALYELMINGSKAAPDFMQPEGVVVYHHASKSYFKRTIEKDDQPKGA